MKFDRKAIKEEIYSYTIHSTYITYDNAKTMFLIYTCQNITLNDNKLRYNIRTPKQKNYMGLNIWEKKMSYLCQIRISPAAISRFVLSKVWQNPRSRIVTLPTSTKGQCPKKSRCHCPAHKRHSSSPHVHFRQMT